MKTTKGGKVMNPTNAYRKELRKKELKREYEEKMQEKSETSVMFSHLGPPHKRTAEEEENVKNPKPEDSVYYHPTLNPTGAPLPGKPPMFKSSIGPRIPLSSASSSIAASSSKTDSEDDVLAIPPPPPPPPLPDSTSVTSADGSVLLGSLPLPPPPPMPPKPATANLPTSLPPPSLLPPPPGPPPKEQVANHPPPPIPLQQSQPLPPGTTGGKERNQCALLNDLSSKEPGQVPLPPPPSPSSGMPPNFGTSQPNGASVSAENKNSHASQEVSKIVPGPPPSRQQPPVPGATIISNLQPDVLPRGISRFPPPPPGPPLPTPPALPSQAPSPGMMVPLIPRPQYGPPPGPHPLMRPPLPPGPPPNFQEEDHAASRPPPPQKPSYVKSAASTVVKKPLAQHTPELTAMVPASVRVRRENVTPKSKPKQSLSTSATAPVTSGPTSVMQESVSSSSAPKAQSIDDSYMAFLEDMKALGALDG